MEYVKFRANKFLYYCFTKDYENILIKYNIVKRQNVSINESLKNGDIIYHVTDNYQLEVLDTTNSTHKNLHYSNYLTKKDYLYLLNNYIYEHNNIIYTFSNLSKKLNNRLQRILWSNKINIDILNYTFTYINETIIDTNYFINVYHAISEKPNWFINNTSDKINYNNKENLIKVQHGLINDLNYIQKNCIDSFLNIQWWTFRGWDETYAKIKISEYQSSNSKKYRKKYNENPEKYKIHIDTCIEYWLNKGYSEEDAKQKLSERQNTFSLQKCIDKYGEEEGRKRFELRQNKWQHTLMNKDNYMEIVYKRTFNGICASKVSQELFKAIHKKLEDYGITDLKIYYQSNNHEWGFGIKNRGGVLYDFVIPSLKYAIEFNGDRFHPNKEKLSSFEWNNWSNPWGKNADLIYKKDLEKNQAIINKGFILDIIWESDYNNNESFYINQSFEKIKKLYEESKVYKN